MNRDEHITFIKSDLSDILSNVVQSTNLLGTGMEAFAVNNYILQSLLLQLTGAQEQKLKCICWELASNDLEYRYETYYQKRWNLGQCSKLEDKNTVYKALWDATGKNKFDESARIFNFLKDKMYSIFNASNIVSFHQQEWETYINFVANIKNIESIVLNDRGQLFTNEELRNLYEQLYRMRNQCAHNLQSFQFNLPSLRKLSDNSYTKYNNIFTFFLVLLLIDEAFKFLFSEYEKLRFNSLL